MKKGINIFLLIMICTFLLVGTAYAENAEGIYDLNVADGVTAVPQLADGSAIIPVPAEIPQGNPVQDLYPNAEKMHLNLTDGIQRDAYYIIMVIKGDSATPTSDNVVFMDQVTSFQDALEYEINPKNLEVGETYHIYISTNVNGGESLMEIGSFQYGKGQIIYTIQFFDEDGITLLGTSNALRGDTPVYHGETPTKAPTEEMCYVFQGWVPEVTEVTEDTSYIASYAENPHQYGDPEWVWASDCSTATATFICSVGGETKTIDAVMGEPVKNEDGSITYTASVVLLGMTYTDSKTLHPLPDGNYILDIDYIYLQVDGSRQLNVLNGDTGEIIDSSYGLVWSGENSEIATVDGNGNVTGHKVGETRVVVTSDDGKIDLTCTLQVLFSDVADTEAYFFNPVMWAVSNGITSGTSATTFGPYNQCTRAQVMTFLYKASGSPDVSGDNPFTDVKEGDYFYNPVLWAVSQGITSGTSATTFSPYNPCTRAQVMAFLYKASGSPDVSGENPFTDVKEEDYFYNPVLWAVSQGITSGTSSTTFSPYNPCTRAQVMTFLYKAFG